MKNTEFRIQNLEYRSKNIGLNKPYSFFCNLFSDFCFLSSISYLLSSIPRLLPPAFYLLSPVFCLLFFGCSKSFDDLDAYEKYVKGEESPYRQTQVVNGVKASLLYLPTDAIMCNYYRNYLGEIKAAENDSSVSSAEKKKLIAEKKKEIEEIKKTFSNSVYFNLTLGYEDETKDLEYASMQQGFDVYSKWLNKLLFGLNEHIYLKTPELDEVPLVTYEMERSFGMTKSRNFLLVFPAEFNEKKILESNWIKVKIKEFGLATGTLSFEYEMPLEEIEYRKQN